MKSRIFIITLLWFVSLVCWAQAEIRNVEFSFNEKTEKITIKYNLNLKSSKEINNVRVYMLLDGATYRLKSVSGDIGTIRTSGNKQIVFDIFKEFGREPITGSFQFRVEGDDNYKEPTEVIVKEILVDTYQDRTTVRKGVELQVDYGFLIPYAAFDFKLFYRHNNPKYGYGIGFGLILDGQSHEGEYSQNNWYLLNINFVRNYSTGKSSPFIIYELGCVKWIKDVYSEEHGRFIIDEEGTNLYLGVTAGYQYSFNSKWAITAKARTTLGIDKGFNFGFSVGAIYHFN